MASGPTSKLCWAPPDQNSGSALGKNPKACCPKKTQSWSEKANRPTGQCAVWFEQVITTGKVRKLLRSRSRLAKFRGSAPANRGGPPSLTPRFFSKSCSSQIIFRGKPLFEQILGSGPPWGQNSAGPLTKILDAPLVRIRKLV